MAGVAVVVASKDNTLGDGSGTSATGETTRMLLGSGVTFSVGAPALVLAVPKSSSFGGRDRFPLVTGVAGTLTAGVAATPSAPPDSSKRRRCAAAKAAAITCKFQPWLWKETRWGK